MLQVACRIPKCRENQTALLIYKSHRKCIISGVHFPPYLEKRAGVTHKPPVLHIPHLDTYNIQLTFTYTHLGLIHTGLCAPRYILILKLRSDIDTCYLIYIYNRIITSEVCSPHITYLTPTVSSKKKI